MSAEAIGSSPITTIECRGLLLISIANTNIKQNIMSKHNNNLSISLSKRCFCGRYITLGEEAAGIGVFRYTCPDCVHKRYSKAITSEEYYLDYDN